MEKKFLKVGKSINFKFNTEGLECDLTPGMVYNIDVDRYTDAISLEETSGLSLPSKVYCTQRDERFIDKVINSYNLSESGFTGVMLAGLKGSGKTVMAKIIANKSSLPIINIDKSIRPYILKNLVEKLGDTSVCFLFDELDKVLEDYDDSVLLQVLDGSDTKGKHMILFTCNDDREISEYLIDRCSRIRYWREFKEMSPSLIMEVLNDKLNDKKEIKSLTDFIKDNFEVCSFDNISSFVKEANDYPTTTFEELFEDMNLSSKGTVKPHSRSCKANCLKNVKKKAASDDICCDCCCAGC
jgi:SpoVK/Ycf46/Vps4 family AAA+-type ATPase